MTDEARIAELESRIAELEARLEAARVAAILTRRVQETSRSWIQCRVCDQRAWEGEVLIHSMWCWPATSLGWERRMPTNALD